jgi:hypothetical protein
MDPNFLLQLSPLELRWLAASFGILHLPVLDDPLRHVPNSQLTDEFKNSMNSLETRGLVSRASSGWQVDRLPAAILKWLGSAAVMLVVDLHLRAGLSRRIQVFTQDDVCMLVSLEDGKYHFLFLPGRMASSDHLLDQFGASSADPEPAPANYTISQPVTILRTAWTNPALAGQMLKVSRFEPGMIESLLAWAASLEWIIALNRIQLEGEEAGSKDQAIVCGSSHGRWSGRVSGNADDAVTLSSIALNEIRDLIGCLL